MFSMLDSSDCHILLKTLFCIILILLTKILTVENLNFNNEIESHFDSNSKTNEDFVKKVDSPKEQNLNKSEITIFSTTAEHPEYNVLELSIQDQCNQLWSYKNQLKKETLKIINFHKEFTYFLNKNNIKKDFFSLEEIFKKSLEISIKNNRVEEIINKFNEYSNLAHDYNFIEMDIDNKKRNILISHQSSFYSSLKDLLSLEKEFFKFNSNIETCIKNKKNIVSQGLSGINSLLFTINCIFEASESNNNEDFSYFKKITTSFKNIDSNFSFVKTLKKLRMICDQGIEQNDSYLKKKQLKWFKKKESTIKKTLVNLETIINVDSKKIRNFLNCISHFQNKETIINTTSAVVNSVGNLIIDYSVNRKNILTIISSVYSYKVLNSYILNNKYFSLWLFVQKRLTNIQIAFLAIKDSNELSVKVSSFLSLEDSTEALSKCSEILRKTASNWDIFFSKENNKIIKSLQKEALNEINQFVSNEDLSYLNSEWNWVFKNIDEFTNNGRKLFENSFDKIIYHPLSNCAKTLSSIYKKLISEFKPEKNLNEKLQNKIMKDHKNLLNDALNNLVKQKRSLTSMKYLFLWPHNNATITSALSIYRSTEELIKQIELNDKTNLNYNSNYSEHLLNQQLFVSGNFSTLYNNIKMRFNWDLNLFQNEFGYLETITYGVEDEEIVKLPKIRIPSDTPLKLGEWFYDILEFSNINKDRSSKINKIVESSTQFRIQFIQQWCDIISKIVLKLGNPMALIVSKVSEEAFMFYLNKQISLSKEFSSNFENNVSISKFVEAVDNSLIYLNKESFISKFETTNIENQDDLHHSEDEFVSTFAIQNYISDLKKRIDKFCNKINDNKLKENKISKIKKLCENISIIFLYLKKNMKELNTDLQKVYSDLSSQETDIKKLDSIIQNCISIKDRAKRVECWIPNQSLELPLRRALQIRRVMTSWLRENIKVNLLEFTNIIEKFLKIDIDGSLVLESKIELINQELANQETIKNVNETFSTLINLLNDVKSHITEELNNIETIYIKYYQNQVEEISNSSKNMVYNYVKLNSMKTTLIHNYGKPNIFQKIFRFPKLLLSKEEVSDIENLIISYKIPVNNNATYAMDLCDYIKNNIISSSNHTVILGKFLRLVSTLKGKLEDFSLSASNNSDIYYFSDSIESIGYKDIQEKALIILDQSENYFKLANVENFRYFTIRNMTDNIVTSISELSNEVEARERELEKKEEQIANTNCYRRLIWKRRVKKRNKKKLNKKQEEKIFKVDKSQGVSRKLLEKKKEINGKLRLILTKTVGIEYIENDDSSNNTEEYLDKSEYDDLESFQFDDLYNFNKQKVSTLKKNVEDIEYDVDTGGHTKIEKNNNNFISKLSNVIHIATNINNSIQQYKEIKAKLKEGGIDASSDNSGVNLMAGFNILNALSGGPSDDLSSMFNSANDQSSVFNEADIMSELQNGEGILGLNKEIKSTKNEQLDISYEDFRRKVESELKKSGLDIEFNMEDE